MFTDSLSYRLHLIDYFFFRVFVYVSDYLMLLYHTAVWWRGQHSNIPPPRRRASVAVADSDRALRRNVLLQALAIVTGDDTRYLHMCICIYMYMQIYVTLNSQASSNVQTGAP